MVRIARYSLLWLAILGGCATPFQGIRVRADVPFIDEAFKKLTIALTLDGYEIESVDPGARIVETKWKELGETDREPKLTDAGVRQEGKVRIKLEFAEPMESTATWALTLAGTPTGSFVTWSMDGTHNFLGKAIGIFMDMDEMLGSDIEKGLARLKTVAEGRKE